MAASLNHSRPGRTGSRELYQERKSTKGGEDSSSRVPNRGRKVVEVGDDGSDRCGICSALVTVRGVLDCCSHVFCFDCIDNWATVSNLCPLCKLQFRFISVESTNVHGSHNGGHQSTPYAVKQEREEEPWGDEDALPFSFPSFFIDEDAVACLEGDRCLIRSGVPLEDEDAADTSVACDSCDRWYHAGCVGFDPSVSWGSWLCPRCSEKAALRRLPPTPSFPSMLPPTTVVSTSASGHVPVAEFAYNAIVLSEHDSSVSISMAEEGESALIFSTRRVPEYKSKLEPQPEQPMTTRDNVATGPREQAPLVVKAEEVTFPALEDKAAIVQAPGPVAVERSLSGDQKLIKSTSTSKTLRPSEAEAIGSTKAALDRGDQRPKAANVVSGTVSTGKAEPVDLAEGVQGQVEPKPNFDQSKEGQSIEPETKGGDTVDHDLSARFYNWAETVAEQEKKGKTKHTKQDRNFIRAEDLPEPPRKVARTALKKKDGLQVSASGAPAEEAVSTRISNKDPEPIDVKETPAAVIEESEVKVLFTEGVLLEDLVHMVKDEHTGGNASNTAGGVRTRVVMRRSTDGSAAQLVEDIRQQMISAAGYGASDDLGKVAVSDDKFFAAFKAALVRTNEQSRGAKAQGLKRRRQSWMAKMFDEAPRGKGGGVRESLTKKLYAGGVSRKTWDRDWDISFWKEQSARLKKARQEASDVVEGRAGQRAGEFWRGSTVVKKEEEILLRFKNKDAEGDSIMTTLYVADTSLFPRDNDIKPLSLLASAKEEGKLNSSAGERDTSGPGGLLNLQTSSQCSADIKPGPISGGVEACVGKLPNPPLQVKASSADTPVRTNKAAVQGTYGHVDESGTLKAGSAPTLPCSPPPSDEKKDKRQWALELLARKSGDATAFSAAKSSAGTKKEFSLLPQVPEELRPTLPPDRRSRVPIAIRQAQLNRILEHYLRRTKLTSLRGGYKLKSVIAAATAKELEIYENSNSKGVYVNLCVRALAQQDEGKLRVTIPQPSKSGGDAAVTEALLATGLISDSPPGSPCEKQNGSIENGPEVSVNQASVHIPKLQEVTMAIGRPTGSKLAMHNTLSNHPVNSTSPQVLKSTPGEAEDVLELAKPLSGDVYEDLDLELEEFEPSLSLRGEDGSSGPDPVASSAVLGSPRNKLKVILTTAKSISSSQVLRDSKNILTETCTEDAVGSEELKTNSDNILVDRPQPSSNEQLSAGEDTIFLSESRESKEGKNVNICEDSHSNDRHCRKTEESAVVKVADKVSTISGEGRKISDVNKSKEAKVEHKRGPATSAGESEGDDWMKSGKFPDLESRIDKMRKDVLEMNSSFLSQFGEENVFGGSLPKPSSSGKVQDGGTLITKSRADNPVIPEEKLKCSTSGGPEAEAMRQSVQKQVESYVKEHLKPLYKSGVIKSDQFRYAVSKTASKVMQHHGDATSADFLIVEGSKVKKLADQYLQAFVHKK